MGDLFVLLVRLPHYFCNVARTNTLLRWQWSTARTQGSSWLHRGFSGQNLQLTSAIWPRRICWIRKLSTSLNLLFRILVKHVRWT
ncbi:putative germin-like protein subfamily 1 member 12 [Phtheirospermum japonicum]|uniref:Putative germin-like protein subfamily 1 member 12 n=1 Tax=Phtheirospermum japonicum TaxID=374723 RepID=A0A830CHW9_9LAMI|nr:putative germin-like protein subfamily 1 member 12 [Phtheirospermum japonicum]